MSIVVVAGLLVPALPATAGPAPAVGQGDLIGAGTPADGTASPPSRDVAAVLRAQAAAPTPAGRTRLAVPTPPFEFATSGFTPHPVPAAELPYALTTPVPRVDTGVHDAEGVRMFLVGTKQYDHPVAQAQYGLANLDSYRLTQDATYLNRAIAQAQRLVDTKVESRGAWFYPYPFDFSVHGLAADTMRAPWYSGMAQGQALSLFVRLYQVTGNADWRVAADQTVLSFTLPVVDGLPSIVHVDSSDHLWIDEYPLSATRDDLIKNRGIYVRISAGSLAGYSVPDRADVSGPVGPFETANYLPQRVATFPAGVTTGYRFTSIGLPGTSKNITLSRASTAPFGKSASFNGARYVLITAGALAGYWVAADHLTLR